MKKKLISGLLTVSLLAALLTGCGNGDSQSGSSDAGGSSAAANNSSEETSGGGQKANSLNLPASTRPHSGPNSLTG